MASSAPPSFSDAAFGEASQYRRGD